MHRIEVGDLKQFKANFECYLYEHELGVGSKDADVGVIKNKNVFTILDIVANEARYTTNYKILVVDTGIVGWLHMPGTWSSWCGEIEVPC